MGELRCLYPDASDEMLELSSVFHDYAKAQSYADLLVSCTTYADIAHKVVCRMYVNGDIDSTRAKSEKFLKLLLPFACLDKHGNGHAAAYHVRRAIDDPLVREERKKADARRRELWHHSNAAEAEGRSVPTFKITLEITSLQSMERLLEFLRSAGSQCHVTVVNDPR